MSRGGCDPVLIRAHGRDPGPSNRRSWGLDRNGGIFLNCAIHDYDMVRFVGGAEITAVSATGAALVHQALRTVGDMDTCTSVLWLSDSAMALTEWSRFTPCGYDVGVEVIGTSGTVTLTQITASRSEVVVERSHARVPQLFQVFGAAFTASIEAFLAAVRDRRPAEPRCRGRTSSAPRGFDGTGLEQLRRSTPRRTASPVGMPPTARRLRPCTLRRRN